MKPRRARPAFSQPRETTPVATEEQDEWIEEGAITQEVAPVDISSSTPVTGLAPEPVVASSISFHPEQDRNGTQSRQDVIVTSTRGTPDEGAALESEEELPRPIPSIDLARMSKKIQSRQVYTSQKQFPTVHPGRPQPTNGEVEIDNDTSPLPAVNSVSPPAHHSPPASRSHSKPVNTPSPTSSPSINNTGLDELFQRVTAVIERAKAAKASRHNTEQDSSVSEDDSEREIELDRNQEFSSDDRVAEFSGEQDEEGGDDMELDDDDETPVKRRPAKVTFADSDCYVEAEHLFDDGVVVDDDSWEEEAVENQRTEKSSHSSSSSNSKETTSKKPARKPKPNLKLKASAKGKKTAKKGKAKEIVPEDGDDDEQEDNEDGLDNPEDPAYEPDAEDYPLKPGPIPNSCLEKLDKASYDFTTQVYALAREYGKRPQELLDASGQGYTSKHQESTWNCFQVYMCVAKGWKKRDNETREDFVKRLAAHYKSKLQKALGDQWQRVDLRRDAMHKYVDWYQRTRQDQIESDRQRKGGSLLRRFNKTVKELNKLQRMAYEAEDLVIMAEVHDLNKPQRSKFTGVGPEYKRIMQMQEVALTKQLKYHSAQLAVAHLQQEDGSAENQDVDIVDIIHLYDGQPEDLTNLRSLMTRSWGVDLKLAMDGACSKMRWKPFGSSARAYHIRMKNWPTGFSAIGAKADGHIENIKAISKPSLQEWMNSRCSYWKAEGKAEENRMEADEDILTEGFLGPYIEAWTEEEINGEVDEGDIPLIIDEEGTVVLCVRDVLKNDTQDSDDEPEQVPPVSKHTKKPSAAPSIDKEDLVSRQPRPRYLQSKSTPPSRDRSQGHGEVDSEDDGNEHDRQRSDEDDDSDGTDSDTVQQRSVMSEKQKGKQSVRLSSKAVSNMKTTARPAHLPPKSVSSSKPAVSTARPANLSSKVPAAASGLSQSSSRQVVTNAGKIVTNFLQTHGGAASLRQPEPGPSTLGSKRKGKELDTEMQPAKKKKSMS
ncbi:hypothetical protein VKT23_020464 [Stygiomarasmius scandens]|uniref:Uncharacterized protein n=1 Tax=Marasmiellus scandens TaxID=2682957 RepID=A0ABR1IJ11_9AGAR